MNLRRITCSFASYCLISVTIFAAEENLTQAFRDALKGIDRIVVERTGFDLQRDAKAPVRLLELKGVEQVESLGQAVEIERRTDHCLCITSPAILFYAGEQLRFGLTLHHSTNLRDEHGPWLGDVVMTEQSAARFRAWFAERGYRGFVELHEAGQHALQEHKNAWSRFLSLFPDGGKDLPGESEYLGQKEEMRRIEMLRTKEPDNAKRILACWRGLAELQLISGGQHHPAQGFLLKVLHHEEPGDLRKALAAISDTDGSAWRGAYFHYDRFDQPAQTGDDPENIQTAVDDDWRIRLVRHQLANERDIFTRFVISKLKHHDGPQVRAFLVEIAEGRHQGPPADVVRLKNDLWAMLTLAQLSDARAGEIAAEKLKNKAMEPAEKLTLEVICAQFDKTVKLGLDHLNKTNSAVAEIAWASLKETADRMSVESLLELAEKSESYEVRKAVKSKLGNRGLRLLDDKERFKHLWSESYEGRVGSLEETRKALGEVEAMAVDNASRRQRAYLLGRLRYFEGWHLIGAGDYEGARSSLIQAEEEEAADELVIVCLATGRLDEAIIHARLGDRNASFLNRRAFIFFARGDFEEAAMDFDAASRLDIVEDSPVVFAHLAHVLSGHEGRSRLPGWENPFADFGSLVDENGKTNYYWPETGIRYLQGKMTWGEIEASVAGLRGDTRAEAHYALSVMCRIKGDLKGEKSHLVAALETKEYRSQGYLQAVVRSKSLPNWRG
jgi:hypothetical protein